MQKEATIFTTFSDQANVCKIISDFIEECFINSNKSYIIYIIVGEEMKQKDSEFVEKLSYDNKKFFVSTNIKQEFDQKIKQERLSSRDFKFSDRTKAKSIKKELGTQRFKFIVKQESMSSKSTKHKRTQFKMSSFLEKIHDTNQFEKLFNEFFSYDRFERLLDKKFNEEEMSEMRIVLVNLNIVFHFRTSTNQIVNKKNFAEIRTSIIDFQNTSIFVVRTRKTRLMKEKKWNKKLGRDFDGEEID